MFLYWIIFGVLLYLFIFERLVETKNGYKHMGNDWNKLYSFCFILILLVLIFIATFRANYIGVDHGNYIYEYNNIFIYGDAYFSEKGYILLNRIVGKLSNGSVKALNFSVSALLIFSFYRYIKTNVPQNYYIFSLIIFVFNPYMYIQSSFNIMRQGCAVAILMFSISFIIEKKYFKFIIMVILSATFHNSTIFFVVLIILRKIEINSKIIRKISFISLILNFSGLGNFIMSGITKMINYGEGYVNYEASVFNNPLFILLIWGVISCFTEIYSELYSNEKEKFFVDLFLISLALMIFTVQNDMMYRVYIEMAFLSIPGIITICKNIKNKNLVIETMFVGYYSIFYIGNVFLWKINGNRSYYPFVFDF